MPLLTHNQKQARTLILTTLEARSGLMVKLAYLYKPDGMRHINAQAVRLAASPAFVRVTSTDAPKRCR